MVELRVLVDLLEGNEHLEEVCFTSARARPPEPPLGRHPRGRMPLLKLLLADNGISVHQGVLLVQALQAGRRAAGARPEQQPDLRAEAIDGGRDDFTSCVEALCDWLQGGPDGNSWVEGEPVATRYRLHELHLVDVALCGRAKDATAPTARRRW